MFCCNDIAKQLNYKTRIYLCRNDYVSPVTHTEYKYRSVQTGSANVPYKQQGTTMLIGPDHNHTKSYLAKIDTTVSDREHTSCKIKLNFKIQKFRY